MRAPGFFVAGLVATAAVLVPPLHGLSERFFSWHMVQHLGLVLIAAPLFARALPALRRPGPIVACVAHAGVLWAWHLPTLYDAALRVDPLHVLEHLSFLVTATVLWIVVFRRDVGALSRMGVVFATGLQSAALGALIAFASEPLYESHLATTGSLTPLEDQQLAGSLMWVPPGVVYLAVMLFLAFRWFSGLDGGSTEQPSLAPGRTS